MDDVFTTQVYTCMYVRILIKPTFSSRETSYDFTEEQISLKVPLVTIPMQAPLYM